MIDLPMQMREFQCTTPAASRLLRDGANEIDRLRAEKQRLAVEAHSYLSQLLQPDGKSTIHWLDISQYSGQEPVLVTSEHKPGWFDIGAPVLGEWRTGTLAGDRMRHEPTHFSRLNPVRKRATN